MTITRKSTTAGILSIISGCYGVAMGAWVTAWGDISSPLAEVAGVNTLPASVAIGLGIVVITGGIYAFKKKLWRFALTSAILAVPLFPIGTALGIPAIIFVSLAKKEFG